MARKKNNRRGKNPPPRSTTPSPSQEPKLPDRRALEGPIFQHLQSLFSDPSNLTPLEQAQELMYEAFGQEDPQRRVAMAQQALQISPDCADAYIVLAEHAPRNRDRINLLTQAVEAGRRAIGKDFDENVGHFWGILETRPYMRARIGLAHELWQGGRRDEAVEHAQDMLRLNPNDNQGIRYTLAGYLLNLDRDDDLGKLLDQYDEGSATWAYTRALLAFRRHGDTAESRKLLAAARKANKHVPDYLLGRKFPPQEGPDSYSPGRESEAVMYAQGFLSAWKGTAGAIAWLRANEGQPKQTQEKAKGPLKLVKTWANTKLTQGSDVWQVDCQQLPMWLTGEGEPTRPWAVLLVERDQNLVLGHEVLVEHPTAALLWDIVLKGMKSPAVGEAHRPAALEVRPGEHWETLRPHFEEIGVPLTTREKLPALDLAFNGLSDHMSRDDRQPILDAPGMTPEKAASYYAAAATFFREAPWKRVGFESAIKIESEHFKLSPWYGVLMGQSGLASGLALYPNFQVLQEMWTGTASDDENASNEAMSVTFGEAWTIPVADLSAIEKYGWEVARSDAYPEMICVQGFRDLREPMAWERELMEACLRAVPEFVKKRKQDDPTPEEITVPVGAEKVKLKLSWMAE